MTATSQDQSLKKVEEVFQNSRRIIVMGVINVTPDSFSDGGCFYDQEQAVHSCYQMVAEGADIIDIGGESSRPGADPVSDEEELRRVIPIIEQVTSFSPIPISIDTRKAIVADRALSAGAAIVNDITGLRDDPAMAQVISDHQAGLVLMHKRGTPKTMQQNTKYDNLIGEIIQFLTDSIEFAENAGIAPNRIMIDPGIGFGKDLQGNIKIIRSINRLADLGKPVMIGASRKSFIGSITNAPVTERLSGSIASATVAVLNGAAAVRVHDVAATRQAVDVAIKLRQDQ